MATLVGLPHSGFEMKRPYRASVGGLRIAMVPNEVGKARVGIAVGKCQTAVQRNLVRRRVREAIRPRLLELMGFDIRVGAAASVADMEFAQLVTDMEVGVERVLKMAKGRTERAL